MGRRGATKGKGLALCEGPAGRDGINCPSPKVKGEGGTIKKLD